MELPELPLEAVALRLYSLPAAAAAAGTAWTCLAAVFAAAAAAGLWRFRASSTLAVAVTSQPPPSSPSPPPPPQEASPPPPPSPPPPSPKVRYTAYFYDAGCVGCCHVDDGNEYDVGEEAEAEEEDDGASEAVTAPSVQWEGVGVRRRPDLGWYRCLDLTALNGSVVRLWDGPDGVRTASSPRRRGSLGITA